MEQRIEEVMKKYFGRGIDQCTDDELFQGLLIMTKADLEGRKPIPGDKKLYYISAEFLIGKLLSNNLINMGIYDEVRDALAPSSSANPSLPSETAVWAGWLPASWTPLRPWTCPVTAWA